MMRRALAAVEIALFLGLIFGAIWMGQSSRFRPPLLVAGLLLIGACAASNRLHSDSREALGLDRRHFRPCFRLTAKVAAAPLGVLLAFALTHPAPPAPKILFGLLGYPLWAFAQEYALLSFLANRLKDALGARSWLVAVVNGFLFAVVHFPNPLLMTASFVGGTAFTRIFLSTPHLVPIALAHAAAGFLLSWIFQAHHAAMMVGPGYLKWSGVFLR